MNTMKPFTRRAIGWSAAVVLVLAVAMMLGGCRKRRGFRSFRQGGYESDHRGHAAVIVVDEGRRPHREDRRWQRNRRERRHHADCSCGGH